MNGKAILDLPMEENDSGADTVRGYFKALLRELIQEEEGFSGKRPFGNSGWQYELYRPLVKAGAVAGDDEGEAQDTDAADALIQSAVDAL